MIDILMSTVDIPDFKTLCKFSYCYCYQNVLSKFEISEVNHSECHNGQYKFRSEEEWIQICRTEVRRNNERRCPLPTLFLSIAQLLRKSC
jgi:hypothetical protein